MKTTIDKTLQQIRLGEPQIFENICIIPLTLPGDKGTGPEYLTMGKALEERLLVVSEVSSSGSVPNLRVENKSELPVLLLDGEELAGAKQNRVLNTTILLKPNSETIIPVSCTEQGRWAYTSPLFRESGTIMSHKARTRKMSGVMENLERGCGPASNQGAVWNEVSELSYKLNVASPSCAMRDVFEQKSRSLRQYLDAFRLCSDQIGLLALIGGRPAGMDLVSREPAYRELHAKLVKSYALEAMATQRDDEMDPKLAPETSMLSPQTLGVEFLKSCMGIPGKKYESAGMGWDWRLKSATVIGSALVLEDTVIHAAFFRNFDEGESRRSPRMAGFESRRRYRDM